MKWKSITTLPVTWGASQVQPVRILIADSSIGHGNASEWVVRFRGWPVRPGKAADTKVDFQSVIA